MRKSEVHIGGRYVAKVSGNLTIIRLTSESPYGGWNAVNERTGKEVRVRTAARLRYPAKKPLPPEYVTGTQMPDGSVHWDTLPGCSPPPALMYSTRTDDSL